MILVQTKIQKISRYAAILCIASFFLAPPLQALAETQQELQDQLNQVEAQITQYEQQLSQTKTEKQTLTNAINKLKKEQQKITLQIKATNLQINQLGNRLDTTQQSITDTESQLEKSKETTAAILRMLYERDSKPLIEVLLQQNSAFTLFKEADISNQLSANLISSLEEMKMLKDNLQSKYSNLASEQDDKKNLLAIQKLQNQQLAGKVGDQSKLLQTTQGKEAKYQAMLTDSQKQAQEIKNRIYQLLGVTQQVTFGDAVSIAQWVSKQTGVRAEFLLAILTQESNLGQNVGTCNRSGDPVSKSWRAVMKPDRDQSPFLAITQSLGKNPDTTSVSCPMRDSQGKQVGWGGAMGPAQFIPSTWMLYKDQIAAITGKPVANPWDIKDAFVAAALLLKDNGATSGASNAEWRAAMLYFSGSTNTRFRFYGDNVVALAKRYQSDIRVLG